MVHRHLGKLLVREEGGNFVGERIAPFLAAAAGAGQQKTALLQIGLEILPLVLSEGERALAGDHGEGEVKDLLLGQLYGLEFAGRIDGGLGGHGGEKLLAEAH